MGEEGEGWQWLWGGLSAEGSLSRRWPELWVLRAGKQVIFHILL